MPKNRPDPPECPHDPVPGAAWIPVYAYKGEWSWALVDEADREWACTYKWGRGRDGYAYRQKRDAETGGVRGLQESMHREIAGTAGTDKITDHINRNRWDNRRANLRAFDSQGEHLQNQTKRSDAKWSRHRGVGMWSQRGLTRWRARGTIAGKTTTIGYFKTEEEAVAARKAWEQEHMPFAS